MLPCCHQQHQHRSAGRVGSLGVSENGSLADYDRHSSANTTQSLSCLIITCDTLGVIIAANRLGDPYVAITEGCICDPLSCKAVNRVVRTWATPCDTDTLVA